MNYGWKKAELSEVCEISSTLVDPRKSDFVNLLHVGAGNMISGTGELIDIKTAQEEGLKSGKFLFDRTMVLYSKIRPYLMKVARPEFDGLCSADVYPLLPKATKLDRDFLFYSLMTKEFTEYAIEGSNRAGMPKVNRDHLFRFATCFPPIGEQKQIVAIVDQAFKAIDVAIENTKQNLANARELFESYLNDVFTQKGNNWKATTLEDVCHNITDGKHGDCENEDNSGYFFLSAKDVKQDRLIYDGSRQITRKDFEENHKRTKLEPGDILITNSGTIGRTAIALEDDKTHRTTFQKSVAILKPIKNKINNEFCRYSLIAHVNDIVAISSGTAQKNLLLRDIRSHRFYMPISVHEQEIIAAKISAISVETQRLETIYRQKLAALTELKQSILQKAFTGELTADQETTP
jgi:type I restriction enzyme, S subunit